MHPYDDQDYEKKYAKEIAEINGLTDGDLMQMRIWQVMEKAMPYGVAPEVADTLNRDVRTIETWRVNPDLVPNTGSLQANDPSGRRGPGHHLNLLLLALNGPFPPGPQLILRWLGLKLGRGQAIQGYQRMEAILHLAEEMQTLGDEVSSLQAKMRGLQEKMAAVVAGWDADEKIPR